LRSRDKLPLATAVLVYMGRAAIGIAAAGSLVMVAVVVCKLLGLSILDRSLGDTAFGVFCAAMLVYVACLLFAKFADRKRGL
jgi:hypothetical protein